MSDWVEYCNLKNEGPFAKQRAANGHPEPYKVKYWSIGNENYLGGEIGAKTAAEWGRFVTESAKMMKRVDPALELSAAALADLDWNVNLLRNTADRLAWISLHYYWDGLWMENKFADYDACMAFSNDMDTPIRKVKGLLSAMGLENRIRIAFDEWNLRGWHHPNVDTALHPDNYVKPRDLNDINSQYTMADAVFTACFLNMMNLNCDIVGMANFAPVVNTRGCIFTHKDGIVLRSTFYVFEMYANELGDTVLDTLAENTPVIAVKDKWGKPAETKALDLAATLNNNGSVVVAAVNKDPQKEQKFRIEWNGQKAPQQYTLHSLSGSSPDSYNDIGHDDAVPESPVSIAYSPGDEIKLPPHSVNIISFK
jgi:alpha-N-arabinofuranosidase